MTAPAFYPTMGTEAASDEPEQVTDVRHTLPILSILFSCLMAAPAFAESEPEPASDGPKWTLQVDPLTTYLGYVHLQVEHALTDHVSVYAGPHMRLFSPPTSEPEDYLGFGLELGVRYFFLGGAPEGPWAQVRGVGAALFAGDDVGPGGYVSALGGYTFIFDDVFVLSGGAGVQYLHYTINDMGPRRVFLALHTTLGVAF